MLYLQFELARALLSTQQLVAPLSSITIQNETRILPTRWIFSAPDPANR
jgi:hypothetical protein